MTPSTELSSPSLPPFLSAIRNHLTRVSYLRTAVSVLQYTYVPSGTQQYVRTSVSSPVGMICTGAYHYGQECKERLILLFTTQRSLHSRPVWWVVKKLFYTDVNRLRIQVILPVVSSYVSLYPLASSMQHISAYRTPRVPSHNYQVYIASAMPESVNTLLLYWHSTSGIVYC